MEVELAPRPDPKPVESRPKGIGLPIGWHAQHAFGIPYRPRDTPVQEDWASVAQKFGVGVQELIYFNFMTNKPDEVNYYLRTFVGCKKISPSGNNWMFSNHASPGIIYIPPPDDTEISFSPEEMCVWMPDDARDFMMRLAAVAQVIDGEPGKRIRRLVQVIIKAGYPAAQELWYYNDMVIRVYVDWKLGNAKRREMTKGTGGVYPFDGESGAYSQQGSMEHNRGHWRIHTVRALFEEFGCEHWDAAAIKRRLLQIDSEMYAGWHELDLIGFKTHQGGGSAYDPEIGHFLDHVTYLSKDPTHLYWAFGS